MTSDVDEGAPGQLGDLLESVSLEKEKFDGFPLLRREPGVESRHQPSSKNELKRMLVERAFSSGVGQVQSCVLQFLAGIEMAGVEVAAPVEGPMVGHVNDPSGSFSVRRIVQSGFAEDE